MRIFLVKQVFFSLFLLLIPLYDIQAAFNLSVLVLDSGSSLRFGRLDGPAWANKEVRLKINSSSNKTYQVFQRLLNPLVNEQGHATDHGALLSYALTGSYTAGSLYNQDKISVGLGEELLYTSNPNGDSDAFTMVYNLDRSKIKSSGNFQGQILYTIRPIGENAQQEVILDVSFEHVNSKSLTLETSQGNQKEVRLSTKSVQDKQGYVQLSFSNNRDTLRVYQEIVVLPEDELNHPLDPQVLKSFTEGKSDLSESTSIEKPLTDRQRQLIYSTTEASDSMMVKFQLDKILILNHPAGLYRGRLRYIVEQGQESTSFDVDLLVDVDRQFQLDVLYPKDGLKYSNLLPGSASQTKEIVVKVQSNLGRPYMVTQNVNSPLTNQEGGKISSEFFQMKVETIENSQGRVEFNDFSSVPSGSVPIFFSNAKGDSAEFKVFYQLIPYPDILPGDYSAAFVFSLNEL